MMDYQQSHGQQQQTQFNNLPAGSSEKMLLWAQSTQYMADSGYTTQAPSISSIDAFLNEDNQMDSTLNASHLQQPSQTSKQQQQQVSQESSQAPVIHQLQPPTQQQQAAPATISQIDHENGSMAWMDSQDTFEAAIKAIPDLVLYLRDEDFAVVSQAAMVVNQMSRKKLSCLALIENENIIQSLVHCLTGDINVETAKNVVGTFYNMSMNKKGANSIIQNSGVPSLINLLSVPMETIVYYAITTLHYCLLANQDVKIQMRKLGGVVKMAPLLRKYTNVKFLAIVVDCLYLLSQNHQESKLQIHESGVHDVLVDFLRTSVYSKLTNLSVKLIKVISVCSQNKKQLMANGAMQALTMHLKNQSCDLQQCLLAIRNLSDAAARLNGFEDLIEPLIKLTSSQDDGINTLAAGVLSNLTCNNENNKLTALRSNGIPILLRIIETQFNKPQLVEPCMSTLKHIINRHNEAAKAQEHLIKMPNAVQLMHTTLGIKKWPVIKATLGVIRNVAHQLHFKQNPQSQFILEKLLHVLFDAFNEAQRTQVVEDVNLIDIVDACCNCIGTFVKDNFPAQMNIRDYNVIPFFAQLFSSPLANIQRSSGSLLSELVKNRECAEIIDQMPNIHTILVKYMNNFANDASLAQTSNILMKQLQELKMLKQRQFQMQPNPIMNEWPHQHQQPPPVQMGFNQQQQMYGEQQFHHPQQQQQQASNTFTLL